MITIDYPTAVVASTSDWSSPPRRRSISTVCGPSHREINQFYAQFFPEKEIPQEYGGYNASYMNHTPHHNMYFGVSFLSGNRSCWVDLESMQFTVDNTKVHSNT
ncbi:unnamed protein product [Haemonchus placei]|uniref:CUB domain-containing protein n=1 Tax=Haemonchus placei TaxID=6290 RepID=A0A0N4X051_HAEPC|nr:unnamed protein product [Haemonchus placei]